MAQALLALLQLGMILRRIESSARQMVALLLLMENRQR
jgi:hypothetical protein